MLLSKLFFFSNWILILIALRNNPISVKYIKVLKKTQNKFASNHDTSKFKTSVKLFKLFMVWLYLEVLQKIVKLDNSYVYYAIVSGNSSVGRAQPCQGWGRQFEPGFPLQFFKNIFLNIYLFFLSQYCSWSYRNF